MPSIVLQSRDFNFFQRHPLSEHQLFATILQSFIDAPPTGELEPITNTYVQSDEADMGMTCDELSELSMPLLVIEEPKNSSHGLGALTGAKFSQLVGF